MPLVQAFGRQRQADLYEFRINLVYKASSRTARTTEKHCLATPSPKDGKEKK